MSSRLYRRAALAVACAASILAVGAFATAAHAGRPGSSVLPLNTTFKVTMTAGQEVKIAFTGGIDDIGEQDVAASAGGLSVVKMSQTGWTLAPRGGGRVSAAVLLFGNSVGGIPIVGFATVPAGATVTASVNGAPSQTIPNGGFSLAISSSGVGATRGPTLSVSPAAVNAGKRVTISGTVAGGCAPGDAVTLTSRAFSATYRFAGLPAVYANVQAKGRFAITTPIPVTRKPGRYSITGRCGGGNLGVVARLRVVKP